MALQQPDMQAIALAPHRLTHSFRCLLQELSYLAAVGQAACETASVLSLTWDLALP